MHKLPHTFCDSCQSLFKPSCYFEFPNSQKKLAPADTSKLIVQVMQVYAPCGNVAAFPAMKFLYKFDPYLIRIRHNKDKRDRDRDRNPERNPETQTQTVTARVDARQRNQSTQTDRPSDFQASDPRTRYSYTPRLKHRPTATSAVFVWNAIRCCLSPAATRRPSES